MAAASLLNESLASLDRNGGLSPGERSTVKEGVVTLAFSPTPFVANDEEAGRYPW